MITEEEFIKNFKWCVPEFALKRIWWWILENFSFRDLGEQK